MRSLLLRRHSTLPLALLVVIGSLVAAPRAARAQRIDELRVGFAPAAHAADSGARDECRLGWQASAAIGAVAGGVNGAVFGWLVWGGSGGFLSSDQQEARRSSRRFMRRGALVGTVVGALWLGVRRVRRMDCPRDATFRPSPDVDAGVHTKSRALGAPTT
jgi:hypothetical protein